MFLFYCLLPLQLLLADPGAQEKAWMEWREETFKKALTSPKSFLNAYQLNQAPKGGHLYLAVSKDKKKTAWGPVQPKEFEAEAQHLGNKIRIQIKGKTLSYLSLEEGKRRQSFPLENGAIAEVVFGKRVHKMWTYLYDPEQIKSFTGFRFFDYNPSAIFNGHFKKQKPHFVSYKTVQGDETRVRQVGNISFSVNGKDHFLPAYNWQAEGEPLKYLAVVFTDLSAGKQTYAGGRELVVDTPSGVVDGMVVKLDFNKTVNFFCAHSPYWHCPVGLQKKLNLNLQAGEMLPLKKVATR